MKIELDGQPLDLSQNFTIEIEDTNPIWNDVGSQSVPATVPSTSRNNLLLGFPTRVDAGRNPNRPERSALVVDGAYIRSGKMNVTEADPNEGVTFNIGFDNSTAYAEWSGRKLGEMSTLPCFYPLASATADVSQLLKTMYKYYTMSRPTVDPLAVFPICVNNQEPSSSDSKDQKIVYWEVLNYVRGSAFYQPSSVKRVIDGVVTAVSIPAGYGVTPFVRVWKVIELLFGELGLKIESNPFKAQKELARLVVLNNCADACCLGYIKYADLMPDCTVGEFLHSLWVRFGLVYSINYDRRTVKLRLIRDIIKDLPSADLLPMVTSRPTITYNTPEYVKLSAKTSIDGAAPAGERLEDFTKGLDLAKVLQGHNVKLWDHPGNSWQGDHLDTSFWDMVDDEDPDYWDQDREPPEPEYPEWDDDDRDYDVDLMSVNESAVPVMQSTAAGASSETSQDDCQTAREYVTGDWYRLDGENATPERIGSGFFSWDPQPEGYNAVDLQSDDECVAVGWVSQLFFDTMGFVGHCPLYLVGARHYHSYIKGGAKQETDGSTPLSFMIAFTKENSTIGRLSAEGVDGNPIVMDDGSSPTLSLFFQFEDGLFAQFWSGYDELLRFANRTVKVEARCNRNFLRSHDIINPVNLSGVNMLIDEIRYSLPAGQTVDAEISLRPLITQDAYNIRREQNIPVFSTASKTLRWELVSETFDTAGEDASFKNAVATQFKSDMGYTPHGTLGNRYDIDARSIVIYARSRYGVTWQTDSSLRAPKYYGDKIGPCKYKATVSVQIYEVIDHSTGPGEEDNWELAQTPLVGFDVDEVEYSVNLIARWFSI